jgi:hypothetical protein
VPGEVGGVGAESGLGREGEAAAVEVGEKLPLLGPINYALTESPNIKSAHYRTI